MWFNTRASGNDPNARLEFHGWEVTDTNCWEWGSTRNEHNYGVLKFKQKHWLAHRFAYSVWVGDIPEGMVVCHTCDNPPCINPNHFWLGTPEENRLDMHAKNRNVSKINMEQAQEIRAAYAAGEYQKVIAERYGINDSMVSQIVRNKYWKI